MQSSKPKHQNRVLTARKQRFLTAVHRLSESLRCAKSFSRKVANGRGTKAASIAAVNGVKLAATLAKKGVVAIKLKPAKTSAKK